MKDLKLNRRDFLKGACVGAFATIAPFRGQAARTNKRPNVLIVIADDMNDYGFYRTLGEVKMPY
ncbi:MAG: twin-arginine translocation signal domain-containing protein, partial [Planctomycetota bacterium]